MAIFTLSLHGLGDLDGFLFLSACVLKKKEWQCPQATQVNKILGLSQNLIRTGYNLLYVEDTKRFTWWEAAESHKVFVGGPDFCSAVSSVILMRTSSNWLLPFTPSHLHQSCDFLLETKPSLRFSCTFTPMSQLNRRGKPTTASVWL